MSLKDSKTEQNLKDAFAGESQANRRYLYFASKAGLDIDGLGRETVETLIANNLVSKFEDFYSLEYNDECPLISKNKMRKAINLAMSTWNFEIPVKIKSLYRNYDWKKIVYKKIKNIN